MRINKFIASATGLSRRAADAAIQEGRVTINGQPAELGDNIDDSQFIRLDDILLKFDTPLTTIMFNKPIGYVCSREGQGSQTIYDLLPAEYHHLKPVGRLDKDSSGLLLLTNDGQLAQELTHPSHTKVKIYEVTLDKALAPLHQQLINDRGVNLEDGLSQLQLEKLDDTAQNWRITMREGRNRQIRRTFEALGYRVQQLRRIQFGPYLLSQLAPTQQFCKLP